MLAQRSNSRELASCRVLVRSCGGAAACGAPPVAPPGEGRCWSGSGLALVEATSRGRLPLALSACKRACLEPDGTSRKPSDPGAHTIRGARQQEHRTVRCKAGTVIQGLKMRCHAVWVLPVADFRCVHGPVVYAGI